MNMLHAQYANPNQSSLCDKTTYTIRFITKPFSVIQYYFYPAFFYLIQQSIDISKVASPRRQGMKKLLVHHNLSSKLIIKQFINFIFLRIFCKQNE